MVNHPLSCLHTVSQNNANGSRGFTKFPWYVNSKCKFKVRQKIGFPPTKTDERGRGNYR